MKQRIANIIIKTSIFLKRINFKLWGILFAIVAMLVLGLMAIVDINNFFDKNYLQFNQVLQVILKYPIEVKKRMPIIQKVVLDYPKEIDTPLKKYICDKFGTYDCKTALAIADAESGFQEQIVNINVDPTTGKKSIDVGIFQINQVHFGQPGCSLKEIVDAYKNVDCAFGIFQASKGWGAWTTFDNGAYLIHYGK